MVRPFDWYMRTWEGSVYSSFKTQFPDKDTKNHLFFYTCIQTETPTKNKNVFGRPGWEINTNKEENYGMCVQRNRGVPLGQEMGAVTTGSRRENDTGRIPTAPPLLSSPPSPFPCCFLPLLWLFFAPLSSGLFECTQSLRRGISGVWGYLSTATRKMRAGVCAIVPAFLCVCLCWVQKLCLWFVC